jgi:proteasome accessory factor B
VAGYGADALVLEPDSLREDVLGRLTAQAGGNR